ncbi:MAG TPA: HipA domain-containing protein [Geobacteraceae bacterium]|nr:HipA domain-containing protein [Geobacteraceae bacterium]
MERLYIFIGQERLGEIRIIDAKGAMDLVYDPAWLSAGGFKISPHLQPDACRPESVRNFLSNLLPEGEWLEDLSRNAACSKANIFGLIAYIGTETTGALSFVLEEEGTPPSTSFREVSREELVARIAERKTRPITMWDETPRLSVAGVQDKLPILKRQDGTLGFGEGDLASTHLLKFGKDASMHLVLNEYICMQLAFAVGLPVAAVTLEDFGEKVLSVQRFDRIWEGDKVKRLHLIDGCQILDIPPTYKYERPFGKSGHVAGLRTGASLPRLFEACRAFCSVPIAAVKNLLDWTLFQLIIGNSDAHGKNISFFVGRNGLGVAPAYDLVCLDLYQYDRDLAMAIGDCFDPDDVATYQLAEMCEECNIPKSQTAKSLKSLCDKTLRVLDSVEFPFPPLSPEEEDFKRRLWSRIGDNARRMQSFTRDLPKVRL